MSVQINEKGEIKINVPGAKVVLTGDCNIEKLQKAIEHVGEVMDGDFTAMAKIGELFAEDDKVAPKD